MRDRELQPLLHAANQELLFHKGTWGGPAGYRWRGPDGVEAGQVPLWEDNVLDLLADRGLITVEPRLGPADCQVAATPAGLAALSSLRQVA